MQAAMSLEELKQLLPDYAKDLRLNLSAVVRPEHLSERQVWMVALACAHAARNSAVVDAITAEAGQHLTPGEMDAARTGAALMAMNNVYYRFVHLVPKPEYRAMPARLRMQGLASHGADPIDFELACLAVSAIHGCGACIQAHEQTLATKGATPAMVQDAVRIASVIQGVAATLSARSAPHSDPTV
jgi:lipoyl-dependent peroxiredoxin subunit D